MRMTILVMGLAVATVGAVTGAWRLSGALSPKSGNPCDGKPGVEHRVTIAAGQVNTPMVNAPRCDRLTITNADSKTRTIAFGRHNQHVAYDGVLEQVLKPGQSVTVALIQTGKFIYHDHQEEAVGGAFTVWR